MFFDLLNTQRPMSLYDCYEILQMQSCYKYISISSQRSVLYLVSWLFHLTLGNAWRSCKTICVCLSAEECSYRNPIEFSVLSALESVSKLLLSSIYPWYPDTQVTITVKCLVISSRDTRSSWTILDVVYTVSRGRMAVLQPVIMCVFPYDAVFAWRLF